MNTQNGWVLLSDEICEYCRIRIGQTVALLLRSDGLDEEGDVAAEDAHALHALRILHHVFGTVTVHHVPVAGAGDGHLADGEVLVQLVEGGGGAGTAGRADRGAHLHALPEVRAEEEAVEEGLHRAGNARVIDWRADDQRVGLLEFRGDFVHDVIEDAFACFVAFPAADAAVDVFVSHVDDFGFHAVFL